MDRRLSILALFVLLLPAVYASKILFVSGGSSASSGTNGTNGLNGTGVSNITFPGNGSMVIDMTDGTIYTSPNLTGSAGTGGNGTDANFGRLNVTNGLYINGVNVPLKSRWVNVTTSDQTVLGTTLANITGLKWNVVANYNYTFDCTLFFSSNLTTNGLSLSLEDWGGTVNRFRAAWEIKQVSATTGNSGSFNVTATKGTSTAVTAANTVYPAYLSGVLFNGNNNLVITPQFSAEIGGSNTTITRDSFCEVSVI